jgi:PKHD-type hydroxylase
MSKIENRNGAWPFHQDHVYDWAHFENAFTKLECEEIIRVGNRHILNEAVISNDATVDYSIRKSETVFLYPSAETSWIFAAITDKILILNDQFFKFNLFGMVEGLQFTRYTEPSGFYGSHMDKGHGAIVRKLSMSVQLTDSSEYDGGELVLHTEKNPTILPREQGKMIVFPSYVLHEVKPVTKGTRYSLVAWFSGENFK